MSKTLPGLGLKGGFADKEKGWGPDMNANVAKLSALVQASVIGRVAAVPAAPVANDRYVLTAAPNAQAIAVFETDAWVYYAPEEGWSVYDRDKNLFITFDGAAWKEATGGSASFPPLAGNKGKALVVNDAEDGVAWGAVGGGGGAGGGSYRKLGSIDLNGKANFNFPDIPQTGLELRLLITGSVAGGSDVLIRLNGSDAAVYDSQRIYSNTAQQGQPSSDHFLGATFWRAFGTLADGNQSYIDMNINNYSKVGYSKTGFATGRQPSTNAASYLMLSGFQARINEAVIRVSGETEAGRLFQAGSRATLYVVGEDAGAGGSGGDGATSGGDFNTGWRKTSDGYIEQWGLTKKQNPVVFSIPFVEGVSNILGSTFEASNNGGIAFSFNVRAVTLNGFISEVRYQQGSAAGAPDGETFRWRAFGR